MVHRLQGRRIVHFLHIGKTGGTAAKSALRGHETAGDYELVLHPHEFTLFDVPAGEKIAFFVRDPISRFCSGFYGRQRQDLPRHIAPWSEGEAIAFARFQTPNELALALSSDDNELQTAAVNAIRTISHLRAPHWTWFADEHHFLARAHDILFIGSQECLNEDFAMLKGILNLPDEVTLPQDDVGSHKNPSHLDRRLDDESIRNLKIWYARDYRFLELCRDVSARIRREYESRLPGSARSAPAGAGERGNKSQSPEVGALS